MDGIEAGLEAERVTIRERWWEDREGKVWVQYNDEPPQLTAFSQVPFVKFNGIAK